MTAVPGSIFDELRGGEPVRCPVCLDQVVFTEDSLYVQRGGGEYTKLPPAPDGDRVRHEHEMHGALVKCPNGSGLGEHYLPLDYVRYGVRNPPLVVGLVGHTGAGKTHLTATMINAITKNQLQAYGVEQRPLDQKWHGDYSKTVVGLLFQGKQLPGTERDEEPSFVDAFLFESGGVARPVAFFDVSGEDLAENIWTSRFLGAVGALIFVVNPFTAFGLGAAQTADQEEEAFTSVIGRVAHAQAAGLQDIAAAIVLTKSDLFRFEPPVDRWLRAGSGEAGRLDPAAIERESQDVYAFLHARGANAWLGPYSRFRRATLHFVSATGGAPVGDTFPRGVRPRRVLEPLVAILAMTGIIQGPDAEQVGW